MRQALAQALPHGEDVALDLRGGIADERTVCRPTAAHARAAPGPVRLADDLTRHRLRFDQKETGWADHQMVDIAGTTWQLEAVDQHVVLRQLTREHLACATFTGETHQ